MDYFLGKFKSARLMQEIEKTEQKNYHRRTFKSNKIYMPGKA